MSILYGVVIAAGYCIPGLAVISSDYGQISPTTNSTNSIELVEMSDLNGTTITTLDESNFTVISPDIFDFNPDGEELDMKLGINNEYEDENEDSNSNRNDDEDDEEQKGEELPTLHQKQNHLSTNSSSNRRSAD